MPSLVIPAYSQDSDGDGIPDTWELQYGLDPLDPETPISTLIKMVI